MPVTANKMPLKLKTYDIPAYFEKDNISLNGSGSFAGPFIS
jgi:hypothetical protein